MKLDTLNRMYHTCGDGWSDREVLTAVASALYIQSQHDADHGLAHRLFEISEEFSIAKERRLEKVSFRNLVGEKLVRLADELDEEVDQEIPWPDPDDVDELDEEVDNFSEYPECKLHHE